MGLPGAGHNPTLGYLVAYTPQQINELMKSQYKLPATPAALEHKLEQQQRQAEEDAKWLQESLIDSTMQRHHTTDTTSTTQLNRVSLGKESQKQNCCTLIYWRCNLFQLKFCKDLCVEASELEWHL